MAWGNKMADTAKLMRMGAEGEEGYKVKKEVSPGSCNWPGTATQDV